MKYARTAGRLALPAAVGAGALSTTAGSALADSQCSYDASFHRVNVYDGSGSADQRIARSGQYIVVKDGANGPTSYCSNATGIATVTNTDKIIVDGTVGGYAIDESGGELGPGWTQETDGKSEIEVTVRAAYDPCPSAPCPLVEVAADPAELGDRDKRAPGLLVQLSRRD